MLVKAYSAAVNGLEVTTITVEVSLTRGVSYRLTGLGDEAVRESRDRIAAALLNTGLKFPVADITANLSPASLRKVGSGFDLPLAVAILAANGDIPSDRLGSYMLVGELSLDGSLQPVKGVLPIAIRARKDQMKGLIVPKANEHEAAVVNQLDVYGMSSITEVIRFLKGDDADFSPCVVDTRKEFYEQQYDFDLDFADVRGQESVKRALEVAAAGGHNLVMIGPPGSGKSMMAKRLPSILPPLTLSESLETTQIHSIAGKLSAGKGLISQRPFRSPHHTISQVALVGGGVDPMPGEISLAHNGVLFADELPEFNKHTLEVLRQPLEDRLITIARAKYTITYPASFMFVASMNPCPCGYYGDPTHVCVCSPGQIQRYMNKISGPLLDRIDIQCEIVYGMSSITEVIRFLKGDDADFSPCVVDTRKEFYEQQYDFDLDFADVRGQESVKRALEVAAAGGHNLVMIGPPGSGKSMMAKRLPSILPPLTLSESLETTQIHSIAGKLSAGKGLISQRPFRSPHHTISQVALVGGGVDPMPGEISLAHNGVLFADELPEFNKHTLEVLRQPLEDRLITIARAKYTITYPASFMFVASMNPCPCGYYGDPTHVCVCSPGQIQRYMNKISGPLLDRIDIQCEITPVPFKDISKAQPGEPSSAIRERVIKARQRQELRYKDIPGVHCNAQMTERMIHQYAEPDEAGISLLRMAMERLNLSARAYNRILKVARTIADIEGSEQLQPSHLAEAISYRNLDRSDWAERGV